MYRFRNGDHVNNILLHRRAKDGNKPSPRCPYGCKNMAGVTYMDGWLHWFLCHGSGAHDISTKGHNDTCKALERGTAKGYMARFRTLRNYGRTDDEPEEYTIPNWMLPGTPGQRGFPDKPDLVIVKG